MSETLVRYINEVDDEIFRELFVEEVALSLVIASFQELTEDTRVLHAQRVQRWLEVAVTSSRPTEGGRQQPLLRELIDALLNGEAPQMKRDELDFLQQVYSLMQTSEHPEQFARPRELMEPHMADLQACAAALEPANALEGISARFTVATEYDIARGPSVEIKRFAGINIAFRGPMYRRQGHIKVVGNVPDHCAMVVENGSCWVNGYVLGKVAVTGNCEVRETIAGIVVSQRRAVRARGILQQAIVIAKEGRVGCSMIQEPLLVYAGAQIRVSGNTVGGRYYSPRVRVGGAVEGGEWQISAAIRAKEFLHSENRPLTLVVRRCLSCRDYGESIDGKVKSALSARNRLITQCDHSRKLFLMQRDELAMYAETALTFLCCGDAVRDDMNRIQFIKRRLLMLDRLISGSFLIKRSVSENSVDDEGGRGEEGEADVERSLREITSDVSQLGSDMEGVQEMIRTWENMVGLLRVCGARGSANKMARMLETVRERITGWVAERDRLQGEYAKIQEEVERAVGRQDLVERARSSNNVSALLAQILDTARTKAPDSPLGKRSRSQFIVMMERTIEKRSSRMVYYAKDVQRLQQRIRELTGALENEFHVPVPPERNRVEIHGAFSGGGRFYFNEYSVGVDLEALDWKPIPVEAPEDTWAYVRGTEGDYKVLRGVQAEVEND